MILFALLPVQVHARTAAVQLFPANQATGINPDTQLVVSFSSAPAIGTSGLIRIYDARDNSLIDTLDMSIPPSPFPTGRAPRMTEAERRAMAASTKASDYQVNTIGGVDFHFFPIIVRGHRATIYPHHGKLKYGRKYRVRMDPGVLKTAEGDFAGFTGDGDWTFTTKAGPPSSDKDHVVVSADGRGDFNTVQGAIDFAPVSPARRVTILIKTGNYEELVFLNGKNNLTIRGEDRAGVQVGYPNNSAFNPPRGGPSRRPAFSIQDAADVQLSNFTINNYFIGQAEALLVRGERIVIDRMELNGSGDALTTHGTVYMVDSKLTGHGDTILGYAALFCLRCEIRSHGPFTWTRTPQGSHGNVFVDSTFIGVNEPLPWTVDPNGTAAQMANKALARLPRNGPGSSQANFPYAEMVVINSRMDGVPPEGWGPIEAAPGFDSSQVRFWEFNTTDLQGRAVDVSQRHAVSKQLKQPQDAKIIADYSRPEFVLGGWKPVVDSSFEGSRASESMMNNPTYEPTLRHVQVNGVRLRIAEVGSGPLILLVHGWPESWYSWRHQMPALAQAGFRVVAPDMRGYGQSDKPGPVESYDIHQVTGDLVELVEALGERSAILVGHDWGAIVTWHAMLLHPQRFSALIAMSVPFNGRGPRSLVETLRAMHGDNFNYILYFQEPGVAEKEFDADPRGILSRLYLSPDSPREAPSVKDPKRAAGGWIPRLGAPKGLPSWLTQQDLDYYVAEFQHAGFRGGINYYRNLQRNWDTTPQLSDAKVSAPVLFIAGDKDVVIRGASAQLLETSMKQAVPGLRAVKLIPNTGHWVQQERAAETNAAMLEFLDREVPRQGRSMTR